MIQSVTVQISTLTHWSRLSRHVLYLCYKECWQSPARVRWENYIRWHTLKIVWHLILPSTLHTNHIVQCKLKITSEVFDLDFNIHAGSMPKLSFEIWTTTSELIVLNSWPLQSISSRSPDRLYLCLPGHVGRRKWTHYNAHGTCTRQRVYEAFTGAWRRRTPASRRLWSASSFMRHWRST